MCVNTKYNKLVCNIEQTDLEKVTSLIMYIQMIMLKNLVESSYKYVLQAVRVQKAYRDSKEVGWLSCCYIYMSTSSINL
jgi:hypothetical protein